MPVFNVTNFMSRFNTSKPMMANDSLKNWPSMVKLKGSSHTELFPTEGIGIDQDNEGTKMSTRQMLSLHNLVLDKTKSSYQAEVPPVNQINKATFKRPASSANKFDYTGRYWRETNLKFKEHHSGQYKNGLIETKLPEEVDEDLDFKATMLQSIEFGPAEEKKKIDKRSEIINSRPAKHIKSVRIQHYGSKSKLKLEPSLQTGEENNPYLVISVMIQPSENTTKNEKTNEVNYVVDKMQNKQEEIKMLEANPMQSFMGDNTVMEVRRPKDPSTLANTNIKNYLDEQSRRAIIAQDDFYRTNMQPLNDINCQEIFKFLIGKPIDNEDYSILDNEWSANLPNPILFSNEFKYHIVNFDQELFLSGKARLLKTKWLEIAPDFVVPGIRDLVYHCSGQNSEIALVILEV